MKPESDEIPLAGGNVGGAVRVGSTVRRPTGAWTPAVHDLLAFLQDRELDGVPRVLGTDDDGREILTYLPGHGVDVDSEIVEDSVLIEAAKWLRKFHDVVRNYRPARDSVWRNGTSASPASGEIICHNDPGAYNWIIDGEQFAGMVDWDMAGPGQPIDDLAFMAWTAIPLFRPIPAADVGRRLTLLVNSYGAFEADAVLDHVDARMQSACNKISEGQRRGDPGMLNLAEAGEPERTVGRLAGLRSRRPEIDAALHP